MRWTLNVKQCVPFHKVSLIHSHEQTEQTDSYFSRFNRTLWITLHACLQYLLCWACALEQQQQKHAPFMYLYVNMCESVFSIFVMNSQPIKNMCCWFSPKYSVALFKWEFILYGYDMFFKLFELTAHTQHKILWMSKWMQAYQCRPCMVYKHLHIHRSFTHTHMRMNVFICQYEVSFHRVAIKMCVVLLFTL